MYVDPKADAYSIFVHIIHIFQNLKQSKIKKKKKISISKSLLWLRVVSANSIFN